MSSALAVLGGFDIYNEDVKALVFLTMLGTEARGSNSATGRVLMNPPF